MQIIARKHLVRFWEKHAETKVPLMRWEQTVKAAKWATMAEIQSVFPKAKVLNAERVRFEVHHNDYRLVAAFDRVGQVAFIKFIGTHKQYDDIDALIVSLF